MILLAAKTSEGGGSPIPSLIMFVLIGGAMYFLLIRPQRARARGVLAAQAALAPGREVVLTSGIYGTVVDVEQGKVGLEIAPGVQITVARAAVAQVIDEPVDAIAEGDDDADAPLH